MISKLSYIETENTVPCRNLALEEYLTFHTEEGECILFLWQNRHTVVIGKNQNCWKECKVNYLEEDGGYLVRRMSGGGAVFHDMGNLNFTFCVRKEDYSVERQLSVIVRAVNKLGIPAEKTGRNDIEADGRKFSGNAFYEKGSYCYHHGTILVDVNKADMSKYLNVSREKLASKSVASVKSRVVNLTEFHPEITISSVKSALKEAFGEIYEGRVNEFPKDRLCPKEIAENEEKFSSWDWKYGKKIPFTYVMSDRFPWGEIELQFSVNAGIVKEVHAFSDAMEQEFIACIPDALKGCMYEEKELAKAIMTAGRKHGIPENTALDIVRLIQESI